MPTMSLSQPIIKALVVLVVQIVLIADTASDKASDAWASSKVVSSASILVYDSLFIVAEIFFLIIAWEAVAHKNTVQVIAATCFNFLLLVYSLIQYFTNRSAATVNSTAYNLLILRLCLIVIIGVCTIAFAAVTWELFLDFGWKIFKQLGADLAIRQMYKRHQILITLLKLDVFFLIGYSVQLATLVLKTTDAETWVQIGLVIPGSVLLLSLAFFSLSREHGPSMLIVMVILGLSPAYFIYRLVRMFTVTRSSGTFYNSYLCYRDFNRGLRQSIEEYQGCKGKTRGIIALEVQPRPSSDLDYEEKADNRERWQLE
ncbi:hypothetical protein BJ085DRAFT_29671 [Dimargaris cristalligena]|uniref:Uncharacterized protein n=1 Tax=Dimargaris cristalligena TaxID=215637 RepID=A0A4Q0A0Y2_9FUNG|nr:hypothetical protein BJ085DRAFT_29671 [Dimargaris cristalligena]|eukprot:RKP39723.1 hypothetical protein BJ085DRAFT_29671 [Dimargaris cristalligena]